MDQKIMELGIRVGESAVRNTALAISDKIKTAKAKKVDKETINELEEIINNLIADKNELIQIAQAYEQEFSMQKISEKDINYITCNFIPVIKKLTEKISDVDDESSKNFNQFIEILKPILSIETLTILQLIGFNFKKAIGEPLTEYVKELIASKTPIGIENQVELKKLDMEREIEFIKASKNCVSELNEL